ncbi:MAG TPA: periplasmic heavy metal sensor [Polyangiales bacterium]|nr:periplasmic heavy metal sensor [Polyangiales bacterium]
MIKRLSWALALSIGLNLFLVGFGVARGWRAHGERRPPGLMHVLGPPTPALREQHEELAAARRRVGQALEAEPFDRARCEQALATLRETAGRGQQLLHRRLLERAQQLSPEERHKLATLRFAGEH